MTGELFALLAAISFGMSSVAIAKGAEKSSGESGVFLSAVMTGLLAGIAWAIIGGERAEGETSSFLGTAIFWFVTSGLLATVGARLMMFRSIELAGVIRASTARRLIPFMSLFLSWIILDEFIASMAGLGMALIAISFMMLYLENRSALRIKTDDTLGRAMISRGLAFGVGSALLYALSFIARKFGLLSMPDAFFGALVGSLTAIGFYICVSVFSPRYRSIVKGALTAPNPWQLFAAFLMSVGQISQFVALMLTSVGRVAFINSIEVYIAAVLSVFVFRTEPMPNRLVMLATIVATAGVLLIAFQS